MEIPVDPSANWVTAAALGALVILGGGALKLLYSLVGLVRMNGFQTHDRRHLTELAEADQAILSHHEVEEKLLQEIARSTSRTVDALERHREEFAEHVSVMECKHKGEDE